MDMDLHLARVQQRWRYANDELAPGESFSLDALAHDFTQLPDNYEGSPDQIADETLDFFCQGQSAPGAASDAGGSIELAADDDSVLMSEVRSEASAIEPILLP